MQKVLVTGISGFIGSHIALALLRRGYHVRGTLRNTRRAAKLQRIFREHLRVRDFERQLEFVEADLLKPDQWPAAMQNIDFVMHVASPVLMRPRKEEAVVQPAVQGTIHVLRAAMDAEVKKFVHTSSIAAMLYGEADGFSRPINEKDWSNPDDPDIPAYAKSKTLAEKTARDMIKPHGQIEYVSINPTVVLGPALESDIGPSLQIISRILQGKIPGYPRISMGIVDVRDVATLHILAMECREPEADRFIANCACVRMAEIGEILRDAFPNHRKIPKRDIPDFMVRMISWFVPQLRPHVPNLGRVRAIDNSKARQLLGWEPKSKQEAITSAAESLLRLGII